MTTRRAFLASLMATAAVGLPKPSGAGIVFTTMEHPWSNLPEHITDLSEASLESLMIKIRDSWSYYSYPSKAWNREQMRGLAAPLREAQNRNLLDAFNSIPS